MYILTDISEPFVESLPQVYILFSLAEQNPQLIGSLGLNGSPPDLLFFLTFSSSIISSTLGIVRFLKDGPSPLLSKEGFLGGMCKPGFILLFINVGSTIVLKGVVLMAFTWTVLDAEMFMSIIVWSSLNLLPQFLFVSKGCQNQTLAARYVV